MEGLRAPSCGREDKEQEHQLGGSERLALFSMKRLRGCGPIDQSELKESKWVAATERFVTSKAETGLPILCLP